MRLTRANQLQVGKLSCWVALRVTAAQTKAHLCAGVSHYSLNVQFSSRRGGDNLHPRTILLRCHNYLFFCMRAITALTPASFAFSCLISTPLTNSLQLSPMLINISCDARKPRIKPFWLTSLPTIFLSNQVTQQACRQFTGDTAENQEVLETGAAWLHRTWSWNTETGLQYFKLGVRFPNGKRCNSAKSFPVCASCWPIKDSDGLWSSHVAYRAFFHHFSSNVHSYLTASAESRKKLKRVKVLIMRHTW